MLTKIPEWTGATLTTEVERIVKTTKCTYLDDLLMGVFISYMKSFASLHYKGASSHVNVDFERPSVEKFVHEFYIYSARQLWQVAYLFKTIGVSSEQQARNRKEIDSLINESLEHVIRAFLPWQSIAKQFAQSQEETPVEEQKPRHVEFDEDSDEEEEEEEKQPPIEISDDVATIEVETIGEEDPMKEIERKVESELVLKL
jgi:ribosomal protein L12E/L44/L45/RPP1/RPP2